jgi:hypothetical protein
VAQIGIIAEEPPKRSLSGVYKKQAGEEYLYAALEHSIVYPNENICFTLTAYLAIPTISFSVILVYTISV